MMVRRIAWLLPLALILPPCFWCAGQSTARPARGRSAKPRARPREFSKEETERAFFLDVFAVVVGARPGGTASSGTAAPASEPKAAAPAPAPAASPPAPRTASSDGVAWSATISSSAIEAEITSIKATLDQATSDPAAFSGDGFKTSRVQLATAAMLFAIIGEFDQEIRWKADAAGARDAMADASSNCNTGSPAVLEQVRRRAADLGRLIEGMPLSEKGRTAENVWGDTCERTLLMRRMDTALKKTIRDATTDQQTFSDGADVAAREGELFAAIADVLRKPGMSDGEDGAYQAFAEQLKTASRDLRDAARAKDLDRTVAAVGSIDAACNACHGRFRQ